jgi:8-oxo-dGTP pyrophosphatase MutT (NUDIX family)
MTNLFDNTHITPTKGGVSATPAVYAGAGLILTRLDGGMIRFLVLRGREGGIWSFSKGRPEARDVGRPLRTAVRETQEETGLINEQDYAIFGHSIRFGKRPYWLAVVRPEAVNRIRLSQREHDAAGWFTWAEIERLPTNTDIRAWIKKTGPDTAFQALISSVVCSAIVSKHLNAEVYNAS